MNSGELDSDRLKELWPESSGLMRFQFWTLLVYTFDAMLVAWLCQGKLVGQYLLVANLFSKLRLLLQSADDAVWPILAAKTDKAVASSVPPTPYVLPLRNVMRDDALGESLSNEAAIANAAHAKNGYFRVRALFEE